MLLNVDEGTSANTKEKHDTKGQRKSISKEMVGTSSNTVLGELQHLDRGLGLTWIDG